MLTKWNEKNKPNIGLQDYFFFGSGWFTARYWIWCLCILSFFSLCFLSVLKISSLQCRKVVSQVITGYLPSFILQLFMSFIPPIMVIFSSIQGYIALSQIEKSACSKVLYFIVWNAFFANVLSGSALYVIDVFLEPKNIPGLLAVAVPGQVFSYFWLL